MKTICILGCGWLGLPLAEKLIANGFAVRGSTTSANKIPILEAIGIRPFLLSLEPGEISGDAETFLNGCDILIVDIPPRFHFEQKIAALIPFVMESEVKKVLLVSSISVYPDDNAVVTEAKIPVPESGNGRQLFAAENLLRNNENFKTTVLRFGGLVGANRHPVKRLAGEEHLENPDAPINLIDQKDCIGIVLRIIEKDCWGEIFNAATPFHPAREKYYVHKALELKLVPPKFSHSKPSVGKTIDPGKLQRLLGYEFQMPEL